MRINTNTAAMNTYTKYNNAVSAKSSALAKLSSGSRINSAADDAAGLAISKSMSAQISGMKQASTNAEDGISLVQTAEGALEETQTMLTRMRDLAVQASNGTLTTSDRDKIASEMKTLVSNIDAINTNTTFNGQKVFGQSAATNVASFQFQTGANQGEVTNVTIGNNGTSGLGLQAITLTTFTQSAAQAALSTLDKAINTVSSQRSNLGATENGLNHTINSLATTTTNLSAANSRIKDVDMAQEMTSYTSADILVQASTSMLSQANSMPQSVLTLLQRI